MVRINCFGVVEWIIEDVVGIDMIILFVFLSNQKKVEEVIGKGFFEYIFIMDVDMMMDQEGNELFICYLFMFFVEFFSYFQVGLEDMVDEIFSCFFVDISLYGDCFGMFQVNFFCYFLGNKESEIIVVIQDVEEKKVNV